MHTSEPIRTLEPRAPQTKAHVEDPRFKPGYDNFGYMGSGNAPDPNFGKPSHMRMTELKKEKQEDIATADALAAKRKQERLQRKEKGERPLYEGDYEQKGWGVKYVKAGKVRDGKVVEKDEELIKKPEEPKPENNVLKMTLSQKKENYNWLETGIKPISKSIFMSTMGHQMNQESDDDEPPAPKKEETYPIKNPTSFNYQEMDRFDNIGVKPKINNPDKYDKKQDDIINQDKRQKQFNYQELDRFDNPGSRVNISHAEPIAKSDVHYFLGNNIEPEKIGKSVLLPETPKQTLTGNWVSSLTKNNDTDKKGALHEESPTKKLNLPNLS